MILESLEHPSVLKDRVTSPSGETTIEGFYEFERGCLRAVIMVAVDGGTRQSREPGVST